MIWIKYVEFITKLVYEVRKLSLHFSDSSYHRSNTISFKEALNFFFEDFLNNSTLYRQALRSSSKGSYLN